MHYVPSKYEKIGSILQNRTEINHSRDVLEGRDPPQGYEPPTGYVPDDYEFKGVNHAQLALEIPDNWWQNVGVGEEDAHEDDLPRLMFRGIPQDERKDEDDPEAGASHEENYHYMARQDQFRSLRTDFRYHRDDCRRHVPLIEPTDYPSGGGQPMRKFLTPGDECPHDGYDGYHPRWDMIRPWDLPISPEEPIGYNYYNGRLWHYAQPPRNTPISDNRVYSNIVVNNTGHVEDLVTRDLQPLVPGIGFSSSSYGYNTSAAREWTLNFTPANGYYGYEDTVARGDHMHQGHYVRPNAGLLGSGYNGSTVVDDWRVDFGTGNNQAARGNHHHAQLNPGNGLSGATYTGEVDREFNVNIGYIAQQLIAGGYLDGLVGEGGGGGEFDGSDYVQKAGDTMSGNLIMQNSAFIRLTQSDNVNQVFIHPSQGVATPLLRITPNYGTDAYAACTIDTNTITFAVGSYRIRMRFGVDGEAHLERAVGSTGVWQPLAWS